MYDWPLLKVKLFQASKSNASLPLSPQPLIVEVTSKGGTALGLVLDQVEPNVPLSKSSQDCKVVTGAA